MHDEFDIEAREARLTNRVDLKPRAIALRHALGMEDPLRSPSKDFLARVVEHLDEENSLEHEELTMFKAAKLKDDVSEILGTEVGSSVGPVVSRTIALLEKEYGKDVATLAEENTSDEEKFEKWENMITSEPFAIDEGSEDEEESDEESNDDE